MTNTVDLIVAGGGIAGVSAAIAASELGLDVLLVEKTERLGGSAPWSGGNLLELQGEGAFDHLRSLSFGRTPDDVLKSYTEGLRVVRSRLERMGAETEDVRDLPHAWPLLPGAESVRYFRVSGAGGAAAALWALLDRSLAKTAVDVRLCATVDDLVLEGGRVAAARIATDDGSYEVRARRGVVVTTGGFENLTDWCDAYLDIPGLAAVVPGANTGDGIRLATSAGAGLWHMSTFFGFWTFTPPDAVVARPVLPIGRSYFIVDSAGRRFHDETGFEAHDLLRPVGAALPRRSIVPGTDAVIIFDESMLAGRPLAPFPTPGFAAWSADNREEVNRGWIAEARSLEQLAAELRIDEEALAATMAQFKSAADVGGDEFGRVPATMQKLDGRLYGIRVRPGVATTSGGPRRGPHAEVLRSNGEAVPGLFAAGGAGSVWGHLTHHGGGLTDGLVFGKLAAQSAYRSS